MVTTACLFFTLLLRLVIVRVRGQVLAAIRSALVVGVAIDARGQHERVVPQGKVVADVRPELGRVIQEVHRRPHT